MKKLLIVTAAALISFTTMAQDKGKKAELKSEKKEQKADEKADRKGERFEEMSAKLNLTAEQKEQMKAINEDFKKQMQELNGNTGMTADDKKAKRQELMKAHREKIHALLTPEQQEQAKTFRKAEMQEHKEGWGDRISNFTKGLNLTADQTTKIDGYKAAFKTDMETIKKNTTLTQDQKEEQIKAAHSKFKEQVMSTLTEEQKKQLKGRRHQHNDEVKKA